MVKYFISFFILFASIECLAGYNANYRSVVTGVYVYAGTDSIYVTLRNKPETGCDNTYFVIPGNTPDIRRQMMLSRLLLAFASKENLNLGYDKEDGACADGRYVSIHRVG